MCTKLQSGVYIYIYTKFSFLNSDSLIHSLDLLNLSTSFTSFKKNKSSTIKGQRVDGEVKAKGKNKGQNSDLLTYNLIAT